ncbi:hypothetical protein ACNFH5_18100 [Pseudomonas sp. NY15435]|uniref:hypothetical protein n=1 Tax=Pseudomonas sp. NY15435 TaxID=3400358 RepID=UPI003A87AFC8
MANVQHIVTGAGVPTSAPPAVGAHYIDTTNKKSYVSTGTASASDWGQPLQTGTLPIVTGTTAPSAAPPAVGAHYINTTAKRTYIAVGTASSTDWLPLVTGAASVVVTGTAAPSTAPPSVGAMFVDTTGKAVYLATGTASAADWGAPVFTGDPPAGGGGNGVEYALTTDEFAPGNTSAIAWPAGQTALQISAGGANTTFTVTMRSMGAEDNVHELLLLVKGSPTQKTLKIIPGVDFSTSTHSVYVVPESAGTPTDAGDNSYTFPIANSINVFRFVRSYDNTVIIPQLQPSE